MKSKLKVKVTDGYDDLGVHKGDFIYIYRDENARISFDEVEGFFDISNYIWDPPNDAVISFYDMVNEASFTINISCDESIDAVIRAYIDTPKEEPIKEKNSQFSIGKIGIIVCIILLVIVATFKPSSESSGESEGEPEALAYAQLAVLSVYPHAEIEYGSRNYTITNTLLRYKVEGKAVIYGRTVDTLVIIEFSDDSYDEYMVDYLQIGKEVIIS